MNKKQKIITIIISILAVLSFSISCYFMATNNKKEEKTNDKEVTKKETITPLMYKVTKDGSDNVIYLFGSMHIVNLKEFDFPKYVIDAYEKSDYLAVEADIVKSQSDPNFVQNELERMKYNDGTTIKDHISEETYNKMIAFLKNRIEYNEEMDTYRAYFFESLLTQYTFADAGIDSSNGVDIHFINEAYKDKKTILEVESVEFQSKLLLGFSDRLYELSLASILDEYDKQVEDAKKLYSAWKKGDPSEIEKIVISQDGDESKYSQEELELLEDYNKRLITDRNVGMKDKLEDYFDNNQKVLYIVGTAHLVGDDGIANLLIKDGYKVVQVNK